jgi:hypothetical protein
MVAGALVALAACAPKPPIGIEVREVFVPTPVACVDAAQIPVEPPRIAERLTGHAVTDLLIVSESALELRKAFQEATALLAGCTR